MAGRPCKTVYEGRYMEPILKRLPRCGVGVDLQKVTKRRTFFDLVCGWDASCWATLSIDLRLANMSMDSVLCDSCAIIFRGPIWSHLFVNLTTQSLALSVLIFLSSLFLLGFSPQSKLPSSPFMTCAKQSTVAWWWGMWSSWKRVVVRVVHG